MRILQFVAFLALLYVLSADSHAHAEEYHSYTGVPFIVYTAFLLGALYFYELKGDTPTGLSVLLGVLSSALVVNLFYQNTPWDDFTAADSMVIALAALMPFAFFSFVKPRIDLITGRGA